MDGTDCLADLPPSAKLVFKVLEYDGPLTQKAIAEESLLSGRTVRFALDRLEECGHVEERVYAADARQRLYEVVDTGEESSDSRRSDAVSSDPDPGSRST